MTFDVKIFCRSCEVCQRATRKNAQTSALLGDIPLIDVPFKWVAINFIGPIIPASMSGHSYILAVEDFMTWYLEAIALWKFNTMTLAKALLSIWAGAGTPQEVLSDNGTQFINSIIDKVNHLLSIRHITTTPYHPQGNRMCERFNGTL